MDTLAPNVIRVKRNNFKLGLFKSEMFIPNFPFQIFQVMPCDLDPTQCQNNGTCLNDNKGGYVCICSKGYTDTNCDIRK